jgi:membrane-associated phospholipid phosphatase
VVLRPRGVLSVVLPGSLFGALIAAAALRAGGGWDRDVQDFLGRYYDRDSLVHAGRMLVWASMVGGAAVALAVVVGLVVRHRSRGALFFALAVSGSVLLSLACKELVRRPSLGESTGYSFPSGNAAVAAAAIAALVLLTPSSRRRIVVGLAGTALAFLNGVALVFLYWHYASDVAAGWCLGITWTAFVALVLPPREAAQRGIGASAGPTVIVRASGRT